MAQTVIWKHFRNWIWHSMWTLLAMIWKLFLPFQKRGQHQLDSNWFKQVCDSKAMVCHAFVPMFPVSGPTSLLLEVLPGNKTATQLNRLTGAMATKHLTVVWALWVEYLALWSVSELGVGELTFTDFGLCFSTISLIGQMGTIANLRLWWLCLQ